MALLWLAACGQPYDVANRYYAAKSFPRKDPSDVEILRVRPTRDFVVIADFQARNETAEGMRRRAADIGADAVIVTLLGGWIAPNAEWAGTVSTGGEWRIVGTAIKYK